MSGIETILLILVIISFLWIISAFVALYFGAPFIRTSNRVNKEILELADIKPGECFFDLGCGFGNTLAYVSKKYGAKAYGIEVSPLHYFISWLRNYANKLVVVRLADFNDFSFNRADIIYCKLSGKLIKKLEKKFKEELKKGARLISYQHQLNEFDYKFVYQIGKNKFYFYEF